VARDHLGVTNRLWTITDSATVSRVIGAMGPKPVYIADGHHRYETGLKYLEERRAAGEVPDDEAAPNYCLMMLVGMSDPGLLILPTHRLIHGLGVDITSKQLESALAIHFNIVDRPGTNAKAAWEYVQMDGAQTVFAFGTAADGQWIVAKLRTLARWGRWPRTKASEWRGLGVSVLHKLVIDRLLRETIGGAPVCKYVHLLSEATDATAKKECQLACLVPPATMGHVERIAGHGEKDAAEVHVFLPEAAHRLVFNSLKKD